MIRGVEFKLLKTFPDDRGFFREVLRQTDDILKPGFGQLSHSLVYQGIVKAWHYHTRQTQWNYVANGLIRVVLYDLRKDSPTYKEIMEFLTGDHQDVRVYSFPPGVAHGYICINGPMNIIYITSGQYDPSEEGRIAFDDKEINYDWFAKNVR